MARIKKIKVNDAVYDVGSDFGDKGSATNPVYFNDGEPVACTYSLNKTVPADAKFTDTVYSHPTHTAKSSGLYKITVDGEGHVSGATAVQKSDITALGIPAQDTNTIYADATQSSAGLMGRMDKIKLDGIAEGANKYILPVAGTVIGGVKSGTDITVDSYGNVSIKDNSHAHTIDNVTNLQSSLDAKVPTTRTINGKALSSNITLSASDVGADASGSASSALTSAKSYADSVAASAASNVKNDLLNGAGAAYDTLKELGDLISANTTAIDALETVATSKANASDLTSHTNNADIHVTAAQKTNWNSAYTHSTSAHAPSNAEKNQNAFSNVKVGTTTIAADTTTDTLTLVAGSNVTITPDATNDKITIAATDTVYTHPNSGVTATSYGDSTNQTPAHGGTFKVPYFTVNAAGHVTAASAHTVTLPTIESISDDAIDTIFANLNA